jgi:rhodanese-related sulfurtransferase
MPGAEDKSIVETLAESSLFGGLAPEVREAIAAAAQEVVLPAGTIIGRAGDRGKACGLVVSGKVQLFRTDNRGAEVEIIRLGPRESFGEVCLLSDEPIVASVRTLEDTRLIFFPREAFAEVIKQYPEVTGAVGQGVSRWMHRISSGIEKRISRQMGAPRLHWFHFVPLMFLSLVCAVAYNLSNPKGLPLLPNRITLEAGSLISAADAYQKFRRGGVLFIDALPSELHDEGHIPNAVNLPLAMFDFMYDMRLGKTDKSQEVIVYGRTISKHYDEEVAQKLLARGFENVKIIEGGLKDWEKNQYPVVS